MRELPPPGAGDSPKLMALAEKFWQEFDPYSLASTGSTYCQRNEDLLLLVASAEIQQWG